MYSLMARRRTGFSLVELLVVIAIIGTLAALMMSAVHQAMATAKKMECTNNLRQMGLGLHIYHDSFGVLPTENGSNQTLYRSLLPYVDQQLVEAQLQKGVAGAEQAQIKLFLCPSRRTPANAPGKRDYGYALTANNGSVFDVPKGISLPAIANGSGTTSTLLLTHVWMDPKTYYTGAAGSDTGWYYFENSRSVADVARFDRDSTGSTNHIGSSHPNTMPCLFADNHVQPIPYQFKQWKEMWAWNNETPVNMQ